MAKIKITENELKQIIRESVESIIKESMEENLQNRFQRRYNTYKDAAKNYNDNYSKEWGDLTDDEKAAWQDKYNQNYGHSVTTGYASSSPTPESYYTSMRNSAKATMDAALNRRGVGAKMKGDLDMANTRLTTTQANMKAASDQIGGGIQNALSMLTGSSRPLEEEVSQDAVAAGEANAQEVAFPGLPNILNNINRLQKGIADLKQKLDVANGKVNQLTKDKANLAARIQTLTQRVQNSQNRVAPISNQTLTTKATQAGMAQA